MSDDDKWIPFLRAVEIVRVRLKVTCAQAEARLRAALAEMHTAPDQQLAERLTALARERSSVSPPHKHQADPGSAMDLLAKAAAQSYLDVQVAAHPLIRESDLLSWLDQFDQERAPDKTAPKMATKPVIEAAITAVYDDAAAAGEQPPNINQMTQTVQLRLQKLGYNKISREKIREIGRDEKFASRRGPSGRRRT